MKAIPETTFNPGSGDVFVDLGFSAAESRSLRLRSRMMTALIDFLEKERLTAVQSAKRLNLPLARIQDLLQGNVDRFSLDELVNLLAEAGLEVDFRIKKAPRRAA